MEIFVILTIIFGITSLILGCLLWIARGFMLKFYGSVRHWILRNYGWGFVYFYEGNKRLTRYYTKLNVNEITYKKKVYANIPEYQFQDFEGIRSIMFNIDDSHPIDPYQQKENKLQNDPTFWDRFAKLIKLYYQTQTNESLVFILVCVILGAVLLNIGITGYAVYKLEELAVMCSNGVVSV